VIDERSRVSLLGPPRREPASASDTNMNRYLNHVVAGASVVLGLLVAQSAGAASLQKLNQSDWWAGVSGLPSYVNMYIYVPDNLATKPPIVVAPHHCQGTGQSTYSEMSSLVAIANSTGFVMIFPEATGQNCWDAGSTRSMKHGGGGDTGAVAQMVTYTLAKYSGDATRVYTVGGSSGGIMTEALLGVYPDVFIAGVSLMGVPCGCWADGYNDVTGNGSTAQWSGSCAGGNVTKTGAAWGDLARSYYPGYTGHRPRLQHWHGTSDTTINFKNMAEDVKQWTNLLGLSETPTGTDMPKSGTTRQFWKNACGYTVYETFALSGVGHAVPFDGTAVAAYFGLATAGGADPETAMCAGGAGGMGGAGGIGGMGGISGAGGASDGGAGAAGGDGGNGGTTGAGGASMGGSSSGDGGSATGGSAATTAGGGSSFGGGGGSTPTAGSSASAGTVGSAGYAGAGVGTGGSITAGTGGAGGSPSAGGSAPLGGNPSTGSAEPGVDSSEGCACVVAGSARSSGPALSSVFLALLALVMRRMPRRAKKTPPSHAKTSAHGAAGALTRSP